MKKIFVFFVLFVVVFVSSCSKDSSTPTPQETYYLTFEFAQTPARSPEGYLYRNVWYQMKATLFNSKGQIVVGEIKRKWVPSGGDLDTYAFMNWSPNIYRTSQSDEYFTIEPNTAISEGSYSEGLITFNAVDKGIEISTTVRVIHE